MEREEKMIPIYICEDENKIRKHIVEKVKEQIKKVNLDMEICCETSDPEQILQNIRHNVRGIYFLDVDFKHERLNGFTLAKQIRKIDPKGFIIFVTIHSELTFETFKMHLQAMDYIIKNQSDMYLQISNCLNIIKEKIVKERGFNKDIFYIETTCNSHEVPLSQIVYFNQKDRKHVVVHTAQEILEFEGRVSDISKHINKDYLKLNSKILLNTKHITKLYLSDQKIELSTGEIFAVSSEIRRKLNQLRFI